MVVIINSHLLATLHICTVQQSHWTLASLFDSKSTGLQHQNTNQYNKSMQNQKILWTILVSTLWQWIIQKMARCWQFLLWTRLIRKNAETEIDRRKDTYTTL